MNFFSVFNQNGKVSDEMKSLLFDPIIHSRYKTFQNYCHHQKYDYSAQDLKKILRYIHHQIQALIQKWSLLEFHILVKTQVFTPYDQDQVYAHVFRNLLKLSPDTALTDQDINTAWALYDNKIESFHVNDLTLEQIKQEMNNLIVEFFGIKKTIKEIREVNSLLQFLGSIHIVSGSLYGQHSLYFFANATLQMIGDHQVYLLDKEWVRTPFAVYPIAAFSNAFHREVMVRKESLRYVFDQKWLQVFNIPDHFHYYIKTDLTKNISEGIKRKALSLFQVSNQEGLKAIHSEFINKAAQNVVYHELGHIVTEGDILSSRAVAIANASKLVEGNILMTLIEILADFAPLVSKLKGTFVNMKDVAQQDVLNAERLFYIYLSDIWFYDTQDTYMFSYSDVLCLLILRYIQIDQQIDFQLMASDLIYDEKVPLAMQNDASLSVFLCQLLEESAENLQLFLEKREFDIEGKKTPYAIIQDNTNKLMEKEGIKKDLNSKPYLFSYFRQLLFFEQQIGFNGSQLDAFLESEQKRVMNRIFIRCAGEKAVADYQGDYRAYIFDEFLKRNLIAFE